MMVIANALFKDEINGFDIISDAQLGASMVPRRISAISENLTEQLDLGRCRWLSIQCNDSAYTSSMVQLMMFAHTVW